MEGSINRGYDLDIHWNSDVFRPEDGGEEDENELFFPQEIETDVTGLRAWVDSGNRDVPDAAGFTLLKMEGRDRSFRGKEAEVKGHLVPLFAFHLAGDFRVERSIGKSADRECEEKKKVCFHCEEYNRNFDGPKRTLFLYKEKMNLCLHCRRRLLTCVCPMIAPFETVSRFVILMHPMEYKKEKVGTGRFSHLILRNSRVIVDVGFDENKEFRSLLQDENFESWVLYPGDEVLNLTAQAPGSLTPKPKQLFVIDGTWACAKKMMKLTKSLHRLPRMSFTTDRVSEFTVKHQPLEGCLSTAESLHQVLLEFNRLGIESTMGREENLMEVFRKTVAQQMELASDPSRNRYRP